MSNVVISIIIPAYNEEAVIEKAVGSVFNQNIEPIEVLVINNTSTDDTASVARKAGASVITEDQKGLQYARSRGLQEAKGEYIVFMDADSWMPQGLLQKSLGYFKKHPDVVGVSCAVDFYDGRLIDVIGLFVFTYIITPCTLSVLRLLNKPDFMIASFILCRKSALHAAGGIDKDFPFLGDDTRISMKLGTQGKVRFLTSLHIKTSARRLQKEGILPTIFRYFSVFLLLHFVSINSAKAFANHYIYKKT